MIQCDFGPWLEIDVSIAVFKMFLVGRCSVLSLEKTLMLGVIGGRKEDDRG